MKRRALLGLVALATLAACGRRGDLRLPDAPPLEAPPLNDSIRDVEQPAAPDDGTDE